MGESLREIFVDLNARMTSNGFALTTGSISDLAGLGLTPERAIGMTFLFHGGDDTTEDGAQVEIVFDGTIEQDERWGYLAVADSKGIYQRAKAA
jgi:hypothetical protein